ncbi:hypothetical protein EPIR_2584 [Erwinia piriflorinigrans CFBP 5888]|uniref:Uncharacterized protein n=1 Tax=Erwinia piriflorinigrans CFBP 5888 TaxID=1161919 RepID=V5Z991_9GAMM|nr:hypothetical protein EPIR_2584 [Erwinia piriflorinigrans CFBP 5888]
MIVGNVMMPPEDEPVERKKCIKFIDNLRQRRSGFIYRLVLCNEKTL